MKDGIQVDLKIEQSYQNSCKLVFHYFSEMYIYCLYEERIQSKETHVSSLVLVCIYWIDTQCKIISYFQKMYTVKHNVFVDAHRV